MPLNVPVHVAAGPVTAAVRTSVFRLKSNPASNADGAFSPMNWGSNVFVRSPKRDCAFAGVNRMLRLATWHDAHVRPLPPNVSFVKRFSPCATCVEAGSVNVAPASLTGVGVALITKCELGTDPHVVTGSVRLRL